VSPWVIKNLLTTGNPVYPNLYSIFGGPTGRRSRSSPLEVAERQRRTARDFATYLMIPLRLVTDNRRFLAATFSGSLMAVFLAGLLHPASWRSRRATCS
jgi:hypothetical protein